MAIEFLRGNFLGKQKTGGSKPLVSCFLFFVLLFLASCSLENPAESTKPYSEYDYAYWFLERQYYFDDLPSSSKYNNPESLFAAVPDVYTRYIVPVKAEATEQAMTTSIHNGSIGIELISYKAEYPLIVSRVYPGSPAEKQGLPRYATLLELNGTSLKNDIYSETYAATMASIDTAIVTYAYQGDTATLHLPKENILAPTVFLDTLTTNNPIITLRKFAISTSNKEKGTIGELDSIVNILKNSTETIVIDISGNPGGIISQCLAAADLFLEGGIMLQTHTKSFLSNGKPTSKWKTYKASPGGIGESLKLLVVTSHNTASCAEIMAMALQQSPRVKLAGTTTFGKGIGQTSWKTPSGALMYITNMMIYNQNKETYHKKGIVPDFLCEQANVACIKAALSSNALSKKIISSTQSIQYNPDDYTPLFTNIEEPVGAIFDLE